MKTGTILVIDDKLVIDYNQNGENKKIALVHDHLFQMGGAERVLFEFCKIYPSSPIYTLIYDKKRDYFFILTAFKSISYKNSI